MSDPEIEIVAEYPSGQPAEVQARAFAFTYLASPDIDIDIILKGCRKAVSWIATGEMPEEQGKRKVRLAEVPK